MSEFSETGISIQATKPILGNCADYNVTLSDSVSAYTHTVQAMGGYWAARVDLSTNREDIDEWLDYGLGRKITTYNSAGYIIWQGCVNVINASLGGLTITRGPLLAVANRVNMVYSTVDTSVIPPAVGVRKRTTIVNSTASQTRWGIMRKILSTGGSTAANATNIQQTYMAETAQPQTTHQISIGTGGSVSLSLDCVGYGQYMNYYPYNNTTHGTTTISARIPLVLAAEPNSIFSTSTARITANALSIPAYENDDKSALAYINGLVALGDATYNRYTFGIYENLEAIYAVAPTTAEYSYNITDGGDIISINSNAVVRPWDVLPARWVFMPDFMPGRIQETGSIRQDPRYLFAESVTYTAPYQVQVNGARIGKLSQYLAQLGLSGIGA